MGVADIETKLLVPISYHISVRPHEPKRGRILTILASVLPAYPRPSYELPFPTSQYSTDPAFRSSFYLAGFSIEKETLSALPLHSTSLHSQLTPLSRTTINVPIMGPSTLMSENIPAGCAPVKCARDIAVPPEDVILAVVGGCRAPCI